MGSIVSAIRKEEGDRAIIRKLRSYTVGYDGEGELDATMKTRDRAGTIFEAILCASKIIDSPTTLIEECDISSDHVHF